MRACRHGTRRMRVNGKREKREEEMVVHFCSLLFVQGRGSFVAVKLDEFDPFGGLAGSLAGYKGIFGSTDCPGLGGLHFIRYSSSLSLTPLHLCLCRCGSRPIEGNTDCAARYQATLLTGSAKPSSLTRKGNRRMKGGQHLSTNAALA